MTLTACGRGLRPFCRGVARRQLVVAACTMLLAMPVAADAHTELRATTPADGARLRSAPRQVVAQYSEPLAEVVETSVALDGSPVPRAAGTLSPIDAGRLEIPIASRGRFGRFAVRWRVTSADGHPLEGSVAFSVSPPPLGPTLQRLSRLITTAVGELRATVA